jgi:hypothetical protein
MSNDMKIPALPHMNNLELEGKSSFFVYRNMPAHQF